MSDGGRQSGNGMPRLSHADAERLISARLDAPLPPEQNRILLAHLSTCPSCRAFASKIETATQGLRGLPMLPASPTVSRQVRERLVQEQSAWMRFSRWMFSGRWGAMPAMASALVLVAAITFTLILRGDGGNGSSRTPIPAASTTDIAINTSSPTAEIVDTETPSPTATNTPYVLRPTTEQTASINIQVTMTPTPEPTDIPTATATATATNTATPEPTDTPTETPTDTPEPTETATSEPTSTAEPTDTAVPPTATEEPTQTPEPTDTPIATKTATPEPTDTPTEEPTETPRPSKTPTPEPTDTPTERPTKTPTPEPTDTPTEEPTNTPRPTKTSTPEPTDTPRPTKTPTPTEEPTQPSQPTIQPSNNGTGSGGGEVTEEPTTEPEATAPVEIEATATDENGSRILPTSGTAEPTEETPTEQSGDETPTEEATNDALTIEGGAGVLDDAAVIGQLGSGVSAPSGGLRMPPDFGMFVVTGPDGALAIVDANGNLIQSLGSAAQPIWSPLGKVLLYASIRGEYPSVAVWDREENQMYEVGADAGENGPVADVPAGWINSQLYYLRSFPSQPGHVELHRAEWNGDGDETIWSSDSVELAGDRPIATFDGILIPTSGSWLFIDPAGNESDLGSNSYGYAGDPLLSPFGSLIAYAAGDQLIIASVTSPGSPQVVIPYPDGISGFAYSPSGEQIVVSDGSTLRVYATDDGSLLGEAGGSSGNTIAHPYWAEDGIRYLAIGQDTTLSIVQPDAFVTP